MDGLNQIASFGAIRVPQAFAAGQTESHAYLLLEAIETSRPTSMFFERFGQSLARLHQSSAQSGTAQFGWRIDNYLGSTHQPNPLTNDWVSFFSEHPAGISTSTRAYQRDGDQ